MTFLRSASSPPMATFRPHFSRLTGPGRPWNFVFRAGITVVVVGGIPFCYCCCCCCLLLLLSVVVVWDYGVSNQRIFTFGQVWRICSGRDYWTPRSAWGLERERRDGVRWLCHIQFIATKYKLQIYNLTAWEGGKAPFEMIIVHCQRWSCHIQIHLWGGSGKSKYKDKTMPESTQQKHINSIVHVIWSEADDMTVDSNNRVSILEWVSKKITTCQIACL